MTFNDKVTYRRLRVRNPAFQTFSDKLAMRDYVANRVGSDRLPNLLGVGDHPLMVAEQEGPYVLKANHGSGMVTFVGKGQVLSTPQQREAESWLSVDYCWDDLEWGYVGARRLLLAEELLHGPGDDGPPCDYKLFTFDGRVEMIQVDAGRFSNHRRMFRNADWTLIPATLGGKEFPEHADSIAPPPNLDIMLTLASRLGRGLTFVRVDLYDLGDRVLVGELTPYPGAGRFQPESTDAWLGKMWRSRPPS